MYQLYPTLLNQYILYQNGSQNASGQPLVSLEALLAMVNREPVLTTDPQQTGLNFEKAVITGKAKEEFPEAIIEQVQNMLPKRFKTQVLSQFDLGNVHFYGFVDVLGEGRAIDIKTTKKYQPNMHAGNAQNLYLLGLKNQKISTLEYIITDFDQVYTETYLLRSFNFNPLLESMYSFCDFLENHRASIHNVRIFGQHKKATALPLFPNL
jgi:hypothetical protein